MSSSISSEKANHGPHEATVPKSSRWTRWITNAVISAVVLVIAILLLMPPLCSPEGLRRSGCKNNLKNIGLALHNYHDAYECFPPAFVADDQGRPMHSWRALILPYLPQNGWNDKQPALQKLYAEYRFDEPWDGPNNQKLAGRIGDIFRCPTEKVEAPASAANFTNYVAVVGPEPPWPGKISKSIKDFDDGASNSILVVEVANSGIHWMEPRDLHVLQMSPTINSKGGQGISSAHTGGANLLLADGAVRFVSDDLSAETIRALLTIKGGEPVPDY